MCRCGLDKLESRKNVTMSKLLTHAFFKITDLPNMCYKLRPFHPPLFEVLGQLKYSTTSSGIEPATFRLVV
jgi:hypothetical protein